MMAEKNELHDIAILARRSIEPGLPTDGAGNPISKGACLHACLVVSMLLLRFTCVIPTVRGGSAGSGALDTTGQWCGHYWVEAQMGSGSTFVVDVTADQFGYEPVVVLPLSQSNERYRKGAQWEVDELFKDLVNDFQCRDLFAV
jgi:hypothetical protein